MLAHTASAIPQTISNGGAFGATCLPFEQYVATVAVWQPGAKLEGPWKSKDKPAKADAVETLVLGTDSTVFGIAAASASAERMSFLDPIGHTWSATDKGQPLRELVGA